MKGLQNKWLWPPVTRSAKLSVWDLWFLPHGPSIKLRFLNSICSTHERITVTTGFQNEIVAGDAAGFRIKDKILVNFGAQTGVNRRHLIRTILNYRGNYHVYGSEGNWLCCPET